MSENMARSLTMEVSAKPKGNAKDAFRPLEDAAAESGKKISNSLSESQDAVLKKIKSVEERLGKIGSGMKLGEDIFEKAFGLSNVDKVMGRVKGQIEFQMRDLHRVAMKLTPEMDARPLEMTLRRLEGQVKQFAGLTKQGLSDAFSSFGRASGGLQQVLVGTSILGSGDQSIEAIIAKMLKVNAVFDVIKGGKEIVTGLVGGFVNAGKAAAVFNTATELSKQMGAVSGVVTERLRGQAAATDQLTASTLRLNAARGVPGVGGGGVGGMTGAGVMPVAGGLGGFGTAAIGIGGGLIGGSAGYAVGGEWGGLAGGLIGGFGAPALAGKIGLGGLAGLGTAIAIPLAGIAMASSALVLSNDRVAKILGDMLPAAKDSAAALKRAEERRANENQIAQATGFRQRDFDVLSKYEFQRPFLDRQEGYQRQLGMMPFDRIGDRLSTESNIRMRGIDPLRDLFSESLGALGRLGPTSDVLATLQGRQGDLARMLGGATDGSLIQRRTTLEAQLQQARGDQNRYAGAGRLSEISEEIRRLQGMTPGHDQTGNLYTPQGAEAVRRYRELQQPQQGGWQGWGPWLGFIPTEAPNRERMEARRQADAERQRLERQFPGIDKVSQESVSPAAIARRAQIERLTREQVALSGQMGVDPGGGGNKIANQEFTRANQRVLEIQQQLIQLQREESSLRVRNLENIKNIAKETEKAAKSQADALRSQQQSEMSNFGLMSPDVQRRALSVGQRLAESLRGGNLEGINEEDLSFARGVGPLRGLVDSLGTRRAEAGGIFQQLEGLNAPGVMSRNNQIEQLEALARQNRQVAVDVESRIVVEMRGVPDQIGETIAREIRPIIRGMVEAIKREMIDMQNQNQAREMMQIQQGKGLGMAPA